MVRLQSQICKLGVLSLRFSSPSPLTCSSTMPWVSPWVAHTFFCCGDLLTWEPARAQWHSQRKEEEKGWHELHFLLGACAPLECCPVQEQIHLGCSHLLPTRCITWDLTRGYPGKPESALSKMHAVLVCVFTLVFAKSEQPNPLEFVVTTRSLKVCCLSIYKVGISASSAVYKLDLSLQFLVPCLPAPVEDIQ